MITKLADAEALHFAHPTTFELPTYWERMNVPVGGLVNLIFEPTTSKECGERMWCIVTENDKGEYIGTLNNIPVSLPYQPDDLVQFSAKHIIDIDTLDDEEPICWECWREAHPEAPWGYCDCCGEPLTQEDYEDLG
jgi:hypothetical protein